ncbi:RHS repeat-associated core domain-containing protein [Actinokineospora fastidiosa]|uniref:RHS repeat-associated core domain-containing protein n=1 Tax=Actinokineospora fastidiosa TaxID=1816 RepID=UPI00166FEB9B|nr:RHS repeat-associated core domain-containing protein [Actinokineospora fastidiosa]
MPTRVIARVLVPVLVFTAVSGLTATNALAASGPSIDIPSIPAVPGSPAVVAPRQQDQATANQLVGNQPAGLTAPDGGGAFTQTPLAASATWEVSPHTGDFTWTYPLRVPPVPGGQAPDLALTYNSATVDGRTSATNNQASWVGDGWQLSVGFIDRTYGACSTDDMGGTTPPPSGDLCYRSDNAISSSWGVLVKGGGTWKLKNDNGTRVDLIKKPALGNGDDDGEHWKITTVDGVQYFYGSRPTANSTWTVPVFGDDAGEPCHASTFADSSCSQAWRWNLDKVIDPHGNVIHYSYDKEMNSYGRNLEDAAVRYVRGGTLRKAEYGLREGQSGNALAIVDFETADRCVPGSDCTPDKPDNWPDVPWDDRCDTATCEDKHSPTFWSTKRLSKVITRAWSGSAYTAVDSWALDHQYPDPGDGEKAALWLKGVTHTGLVGGSLSLPPVTFEGKKMANRVESVDGVGPLNRYRVTAVVSEAGGITEVVYAAPNCVAGGSMPASPATNTLRCYPATWKKKDFAERSDHFHKYVVDTVRVSDRMATSADQIVRYEYLGGAAWHYDESEFTDPEDKTWDEFRGYGRVRVHRGLDEDISPISTVEHRYLRGMDGDKLPVGTRDVSVVDSENLAREDHDWLRGFEYETLTYLGQTETVLAKTISSPVWRGPTATRDHLKAYMVHIGKSESYTALTTGWRKTRTEYTYDEWGQKTSVDEHGDLATTTDDKCTRVHYARNSADWLMAFPYRSETVSVRCAADPVFPEDALSDSRAAFDGQAFGTPPIKGDVTKTQTLLERPAAGPVYQTTGTADYDAYGRAVTVADVHGTTTAVAYTPATGGPVTQVKSTGPLGAATLTLDPARGLTTKSRDLNGNTSEVKYDPLGRTVEVWLPNRPRSRYSATTRYTYDIRNDRPSSVTTASIGANGTYLVGSTIYDGNYRERQRQVATNGGRLLIDTHYDSQGRASVVTKPYLASGAVDGVLLNPSETDVPAATRNEYDGAGRLVAEVFLAAGQERWRTTTRHEGDRTHVIPPAGGTLSTSIVNAQGQTTELRHYKTSDLNGSYDKTTYTYDAAGNLTSTTNAAGDVWRWFHDLRGNTVRTEDPDKGVTTSTFGPTGLQETTTDARNVTLAYKYDALGRRTEVREDNPTGPLLQQLTYDTALFGKGQLAASTRFVGEHAYTTRVDSYTPLNKPSRTSVVIPEVEGVLSGTYTTDYTYTFDGQLSGQTLPGVPAVGLSGEAVTHTFDQYNRITATEAGSDTVVSATDYTSYGEVARLHLGVEGHRAWVTHVYEPDTRRPSRTVVDAEVPAPMQADINYTHDPSGRITSISDAVIGQPADRQCFEHDHVGRLTEAWTPAGSCSESRSAALLGGPAPYWHSYTYDAAGNRLTETRHATAGDTTRAYTYPPDSQPHTVRSVATTGPGGTTTDTFGYDARGNTTGRSLDGVDQTLEWDSESRLAKVTAGTESTGFIYTADGSRLLRKAPDGVTLYLDGQEVRLVAGTATVTVTRYYKHGERTVAMRVSGKLSWIASDHQATPHISIDVSSMSVVKRRQLPFGSPRGGAAPLLAGDRGFVGGVMDASTGLTHIGARQYDPEIGRFLSVDPLIDVKDPRQWNPYVYAANSPVTMSDPTGLAYACPDFSCRGQRGPNGPNVGPGPKETDIRAAQDQARNNQVFKKYQVAEDPRGMYAIMDAEPLVIAEWDALIEYACGERISIESFTGCGPVDTVQFFALAHNMKALKMQAFAVSERLYPDEYWVGGRRDAFRHMYWSATMALMYGTDFSFELGTAHEQRPGNSPLQESMDLYNNSLGRSMLLSAPYHDMALDEAFALLEVEIQAAVDGGEAKVIGPDFRLRDSNQVPRGYQYDEPGEAGALADTGRSSQPGVAPVDTPCVGSWHGHCFDR